MFITHHVPLQHIAVLFQNGIPVRALEPGVHTLWGFGLRVESFDTTKLFDKIPDAVRAVIGDERFAEADVGVAERAVLLRRGRPITFLRPGRHRFWNVDPDLELRVYDTREPVPVLTDELLAIIPPAEIVRETIFEYQRGLLYRDGRFVRVLEPGAHAFWTNVASQVALRVVDMRRKQIAIAGQELMTKDKVTLRLSLTLDYAPADPQTAQHVISNAEVALYAIAQLALRDYVAAVTLDELLEARDALSKHLASVTRDEALGFGVRILSIGVKDVILPGEMKTLLNRVIEAEKQALANVILRREDAQATRAMANAAKVMAENPVLLRLKELEALERVAGKVGEVKLAIGGDAAGAALRKLLGP